VYPAGVNISAQIKLKVRVQPDGIVRSVAPAQKGDTRLENAAISKVKLWKFEPLLSSQAQMEQECSITFNFTLK
jgi:TonB family protein